MKNLIKSVFIFLLAALIINLDAGGLLSRAGGKQRVAPQDRVVKTPAPLKANDPGADFIEVPATFDLTAPGDASSTSGTHTKRTVLSKVRPDPLPGAPAVGTPSIVLSGAQKKKLADFRDLKAKALDALSRAQAADSRGDGEAARALREKARGYTAQRNGMIPESDDLKNNRQTISEIIRRNNALEREIEAHKANARAFALADDRSAGVQELKSKKQKELEIQKNNNSLATLRQQQDRLRELLVVSQ